MAAVAEQNVAAIVVPMTSAGFCAPAAARMAMIVVGTIAVSYTHLDVYKRQDESLLF